MYIPEHEVRSVLTYEALIPAIRQALIDYSAGRVEQPARMVLRARGGDGRSDGWFAVMPVIAGDVMGVKTVTFYPGNAELGLHTHMAMIELLRRSTGEPLAVMDGRLITEMRTAAVSAVALDALTAKRAPSLGILGSGVQARSHIRALRLVRPEIREIRVWSRTAENARKLAEETGARAVAIEEAAACDVVLTVTSSTAPVLEGDGWRRMHWSSPSARRGAILRELDDAVMLTSTVVAESRSCAERESGDIRLSGARVQWEIGEILAATAKAPSGRIVFKSVGMAIEDLTGARLVWEALGRRQK